MSCVALPSGLWSLLLLGVYRLYRTMRYQLGVGPQPGTFPIADPATFMPSCQILSIVLQSKLRVTGVNVVALLAIVLIFRLLQVPRPSLQPIGDLRL